MAELVRIKSALTGFVFNFLPRLPILTSYKIRLNNHNSGGCEGGAEGAGEAGGESDSWDLYIMVNYPDLISEGILSLEPNGIDSHLREF